MRTIREWRVGDDQAYLFSCEGVHRGARWQDGVMLEWWVYRPFELQVEGARWIPSNWEIL